MATRIIHLDPRGGRISARAAAGPGATAAGRVSASGPGTTLLRGVSRVAGILARLDALYRTRRHLAEMDDRMLRDIGITRGDVEEELRRPISWRSLLFRG